MYSVCAGLYGCTTKLVRIPAGKTADIRPQVQKAQLCIASWWIKTVSWNSCSHMAANGIPELQPVTCPFILRLERWGLNK